MAAHSTEAPATGGNAKAAAVAATPAAETSGGGLKAWLPLIVVLIMMPVLAYVTTAFVLIPKMKSALGPAGVQAGEKSGEEGHTKEEAAKAGHGTDAAGNPGEAEGHAKPAAEPRESGHSGKGSAKGKYSADMDKLVVNITGSLGSRYLVARFSLVSANSKIKELVEDNSALLKHLTITTLRSKTIQELEKAGAINLIQSELISAFNGALGSGLVKEIYFTDFAIQ